MDVLKIISSKSLVYLEENEDENFVWHAKIIQSHAMYGGNVPIIPAFQRQWQKNHEFRVSTGYILSQNILNQLMQAKEIPRNSRPKLPDADVVFLLHMLMWQEFAFQIPLPDVFSKNMCLINKWIITMTSASCFTHISVRHGGTRL